MNTGVLVPAFLAAAAIGVRALVGNSRAPYPYEFMSWGLVYGACGMIGSSEFGEALAWAYLVAMLVAPTYANVWRLVPTGKAVPNPKGGANASPVSKGNPQGIPATG